MLVCTREGRPSESILGQACIHPPYAWVWQRDRQGPGASRQEGSRTRVEREESKPCCVIPSSSQRTPTIPSWLMFSTSRRPILSARIERKHCCALLTPLSRLSCATSTSAARFRSEEHTSELQ